MMNVVHAAVVPVVSMVGDGYFVSVMRILWGMPIHRPCGIKEGHASCIEGVLVREYNQESCQEVLPGWGERGGRSLIPDCEGARKVSRKIHDSGRHWTNEHYDFPDEFRGEIDRIWPTNLPSTS